MLVKNKVHFPLTGGIDSKSHPFAVEWPFLALCENAVFDEPGAIKQRPGHQSFSLAVADAATMSVTALTSGTAVATSAPAMASVTTSATKLAILSVVSFKSGGGTPVTPTVGGTGRFWEQVATVVVTSNDPESFPNKRLTVFRSFNPVDITGADTITFPGPETQSNVTWSMREWGGIHIGASTDAAIVQSGTNSASGAGASSLTVTLSAFGSPTNGADGSFTGAAPVTPGSGWTEVHDLGTVPLETQYRLSEDTTVSATFSATQYCAGVAIEIKQRVAATLINIKGLETRDDELICFAERSDDPGNPRVFSWSSALGKWQDRGHYEGVKLTTKDIAQDSTDQVYCDRARYKDGNTIVDCYVWALGNTGNFASYAQLFDGSTGVPLTSKVELPGGDAQQPRIVYIDNGSGTRRFVILYTANAGSFIRFILVNPLDPSTLTGATSASATDLTPGIATADGPFDVTTDGTAAYVVYCSSNLVEYRIKKIEANGAVTNATKTRSTRSTLPVGIASTPLGGGVLGVVRYDGSPGTLRADWITTSTLADAGIVDFPIDATPGSGGQMKLAPCWGESLETDGSLRFYVFYSTRVTVTSTIDVVKCKAMDGLARLFSITGPSGATYWCLHADIATRAFSRGRHIYLGVHAFQSDGSGTVRSDAQVDVIIYREDGQIIARPLQWTARTPAGTSADAGPGYSHLPQFFENAGNDIFLTTLTRRDRLSLDSDNQTANYSDRGIEDVVVDFTSALPYRGVQLGRTLYLPGGYVAMYDGEGVVEAGVFHAPGTPGNAAVSNGTGTLTSNSTYFYRVYRAWRNAKSEVERSSWTSLYRAVLGGTDDTVTWTPRNYPHTMKRGSNREHLTIEMYRGEAGLGEALYQVTNPDPSDTAGPNRHIVNDPTLDYQSFEDNLADTSAPTFPNTGLVGKAPDPHNAGLLDNLSPNYCSIIAQGQGRLFMAGGRDPDTVMYSQLWQEGSIASFNDALQIIVPRDGGVVTGLWATDSMVFIFKRQRVYVAQGVGSPNVPDGSGYGEPQLLSADTGCVGQETICQTPAGVIFKSPKGWRLLNGTQIVDIGAPVRDYDSQTFVAILPLENRDVVLAVTSSGKALAYDYFMNQWSTWTNPVGVAAVLWNGTYVYATASLIYQSDDSFRTDAGAGYHLDVEITWLNFDGMSGFGRCWEFSILGEYVAAHRLRVQVYYDNVYTVVDDQKWNPDTTRYEIRVRPSRPKGKSIKIRMTSTNSDGTNNPPAGDSMKLVAISFVIGTKQGLNKSDRSM